jgi:HlyD family secretion protein
VSNALWVPTAAVKWQGRDAAVWTLNGGRPALTSVRIGMQTLDGRSQIVEGLAEGDPVVLYSPREVAAGERVRVVEKLARSGA